MKYRSRKSTKCYTFRGFFNFKRTLWKLYYETLQLDQFIGILEKYGLLLVERKHLNFMKKICESLSMS